MGLDIFILEDRDPESKDIAYWRGRRDIVDAIDIGFENGDVIGMRREDVVVLINRLILNIVEEDHPCPEYFSKDMEELAEVLLWMVGNKRKRVWFHANW